MATRYAFNGQELTLAQVKKLAVGKSIDFMGHDEKPTFHIVMNEGGTVFKITRAQFKTAKLEDLTTEGTLERFNTLEIKKLLSEMSMSDKCAFNVWCTQGERTTEDKLQYLKAL